MHEAREKGKTTDMETSSCPCFFCGGPFHLATGHVYWPSGTPACRSCFVRFMRWVEGHTNKRPGKRNKGPKTRESFYEAAARK